MVIIVFISTLCVTSANAWKKEHEKQKKSAYDTHQLPDDFVVSYELQSKQNDTTPRPETHTSWLSNEGLGNARLNLKTDMDPAYGSIGSGLNNGLATGRSVYGSSSVYQALATDQLPVDGHRNLQAATYAGLNSAYASRRQLNNGKVNYWTHKNEEGDYITCGDAQGETFY
jgi:hypothetical protein